MNLIKNIGTNPGKVWRVGAATWRRSKEPLWRNRH
jgi:hypothetical protein